MKEEKNLFNIRRENKNRKKKKKRWVKVEIRETKCSESTKTKGAERWAKGVRD